MKGSLYKRGDIVKLRGDFHQDWKHQFEDTAIVLVAMDDYRPENGAKPPDGYVYKLLIGDITENYHEDYIESVKDKGQ